MEMTSWIITVLIISTLHGICTWKLYLKAGRKTWEAFVPVYNGIVLMQIINRPKWWVFLMFLPVINLLILPVIWIETLRTFGKKSTADMWLGVVTFGLYVGYINYTQDVSYEAERDTKPATKALDTLGSITFALIVATFVHTYFIQPFVIPSSSLEKSLLKGDFLFVSKFHYGARIPMTPISAPMVHDTIPIIHKKSYSTWPSFPYYRLPAVSKIERNDIVVFNWPADTLFHMYKVADKKYIKPIDKKTNYVKRCTAIPGDIIQIKDGILMINGKESILPERAHPQFRHSVYSKNGVSTASLFNAGSTEFYRTFIVNIYNEKQSNLIQLYAKGAIKNEDGSFTIYTESEGIPEKLLQENNLSLEEINDLKREALLTNENAGKLRKFEKIDSVIRNISKTDTIVSEIFPHNQKWTQDNLGPIKIPSKNDVITLSMENIAFYKKIITEYEHNTLSISGNEIKINNKITRKYTIKQDYFWLMGDNRHNSLDSRFWGFVPEDHIVGKPIFVWLSVEGIEKGFGNIKNWRPRWDRMFTVVHGDGQPESYFKYFLFLLAAYFAWDWYRSKKKKKETDLL